MKDSQTQTKPLARKEGLVVEQLPDEMLVYDLDSDRAHCLNETAAFVWQRCDGRRTTSDIARQLGKKVNATVDEKVVWLALDQLDRSNLLSRRPVMQPPMTGLNRRQMVRALGLAAIVAVPVVTSIVAPSPAQAASCSTSGQSCASLACCPPCVCSGSPTFTCSGVC